MMMIMAAIVSEIDLRLEMYSKIRKHKCWPITENKKKNKKVSEMT